MKFPDDYQNKIICGDCLEVMKQLPDKCVDLVLTDPPYPKEFLPLYPKVWQACDRVLKDTGLCIAMVGQYYLPEVINSFPKNWEYLWCGCFESRQMAVAIWPRGISSAWKPFLIYGKGVFKQFKHWKYDTIAAGGGYLQPKEFHEWGQDVSQIYTLIERFELQGVILDPMCGSGSFLVAAEQLGRKWIGIEISEQYCEIARQRIKAVQTGVPVKEQRQGQMSLLEFTK